MRESKKVKVYICDDGVLSLEDELVGILGREVERIDRGYVDAPLTAATGLAYSDNGGSGFNLIFDGVLKEY